MVAKVPCFTPAPLCGLAYVRDGHMLENTGTCLQVPPTKNLVRSIDDFWLTKVKFLDGAKT